MNLSDVYSFIDSKKRKLSGLLSDPGATIDQYIGQIKEDNDKRLNLQANAYPMKGDKSVLNSPHQLDRFRRELADEGASMAMAGMFVGQGSSTWNKAEADKALKMAQSGTDPRKIWSETGNWKGPDGAWRQEIDDSKSQFVSQFPKPDGKEMNGVFAAQDLVRSTDAMKREARAAGGFTIPGFYADKPGLYDQYVKAKNLLGSYESKYVAPQHKSGILEKFITHDDLYDAYPSLSRTRTIHNRSHSGGAYSEESKDILIGGGDEKSIGLHEVQHAIQQREGWAKGGSPDGLSGALASDAFKLRKQARKLDESAWRNDPLGPSELLKPGARKKALAMEKQASDLESWISRIDEFGDGYANTAYKNLAGEAEARATQARIPLDAAQRRALFPEDSYDVPVNGLIVRGLLK